MSLLEVKNVSKEFMVFKRNKGLASSLKALFSRDYEVKKAVNNISFNINKGELIGYIGSNGAGKSTTIKMLSGILVPTSGSILVDGMVPSDHRKANAQKIGVVFGQRSQLYWNLPMEETFSLYKKIYRIDNKRFKENVDFFVELLEMSSFLRSPVRQLSLGQRMRAELVISLLHDPKIIYLDEPTIGLDIHVKKKIRKFILKLNEEKKTTVILTTHDMDDIDKICNRIITINKGEIVYDGAIQSFKNIFGNGHKIIVDFSSHDINIRDQRIVLIKDEGQRKTFKFDKDKIPVTEVLSILSKNNEILDLKLMEPDIEDAVSSILMK